jgi:tetratricopeptide (TPR) repeat protein
MHWLYGRLLIGFGRMDEAAHEFELAEELCPSEPFSTMSRGHAYLAKKDFVTALKYYKRAIAFEDRFAGAHFFANRVYEEMKDFPHAIQELEKADQLFGQDKGKQYYDELLERSQREGLKGYWERRLQEAQSESPPDLYKIPAILAHLGRTREAYAYLEQACRKGVYWLGDSLLDPCWNRNDEGFREVARRTWEAKYPETKGR